MNEEQTRVLRVARKLQEAGYAVREVRLEPDGEDVVGEVFAETTAVICREPYRFPVVLSMGREEWTYEVVNPGVLGDLLQFPPGAIFRRERRGVEGAGAHPPAPQHGSRGRSARSA